MAQWEDDLRAVVEHRGAALVARARTLVPDEDQDRAVGLTADALAAAFRRGGRRTTGEHGSVRLVDDDELDALAAQVGREQDRLVRASRAGEAPRDRATPPATAPDDGPSDDLTARLPEVVAQVGLARRRGRRRALLGSAAVVVVAALATTAAATRPWDRPAPTPTSTPYAGACGAALPTGHSLMPVRYDAEASSSTTTVLPDSTWDAAFTTEATLTGDQIGVLETLTPEVVLAQHGKIVALGASTGDEKYQDEDGDDTSTPPWPGEGDWVGLDSDDVDVEPTPTSYAVRFTACDGGTVKPGAYQAYLFATADDQKQHVLSDATALTVLPPTPDGYQPAWLAGSPLACGEKADDFVLRAAAFPVDQLDQVGSAFYDDGEAIILRNNGASRKVKVPRGAVAWVQDGRIVGVGPDERATTATTVHHGTQVEVSARPWDATDYCTPTTGDKPGHLPAGTYQAILYARIPADDPSEPDRWVIEDARGNDLQVREGGKVAYGDAAGSADAVALARKGYQPPWVEGSPLRCRMTADAFTQASARRPPATLAGSWSSDSDGSFGTDLVAKGTRKSTLVTPPRIGVAWFTATPEDQPGTLVSFGSSLGRARRATLDTSVPRSTALDASDTCAPSRGGEFADKLPAGHYWVSFYTWVRGADGLQQWLTDGGAMGVTVGADGSITGR